MFIMLYLLQIDKTYAESNMPTLRIINPVRMSGEGGVVGIINIFINAIVMIGIPLAALFYLWAGFLFLTSGGQEKPIKTAKQTIIWTTVGVIVLIIGRSIVPLVQSIFTM